MKNYILIIMMVAFTSCDVDKFLDVKPTGSLIPTTVEDFDKLLMNVSIGENCWQNMVYRDPDTYLTEQAYDLLYGYKKQYLWDDKPYTVEDIDFDWEYRYHNIYIYNFIIENIDNAQLGSKTETDRLKIKGEAYAQRAFDYFLLVNEYAPHYSKANKSELAIPLVLVPDLSAQLSKSTVEEIYVQILSDLTIAEKLLTNAPIIIKEANFRPGKASLLGFKAMLNLYMGNFENAKKYSNEALALYNFLYDFNEIKWNDIVNFTPWDGVNLPDLTTSVDSKSVVWSRSTMQYFADPIHYYPKDLAALYDKANDRRWYLFSSTTDSEGDDVSPNWAFAAYSVNFQAGITIPQLYLINAEAKARTKDGVGALQALDALLVKRISGHTALTYTTDADALQLVKNERRKELILTGHNLTDLKRYHAWGEMIPTFVRTVYGQTYTLTPGSKKYVVPIPEKVKNFSLNLQ